MEDGQFNRYIAVDWKLRLTDGKQRPDNPYRAPTADLSRQSGHWTEPEIKWAKKYHRSLNFSYLNGCGIFVWVQVFLDFVVSATGLEYRMESITFGFFVVGLLGLILVVPACNLHVNYQVRRASKHEYTKKILKAHYRIDNHPVVLAVLAMVLVSLPYVFPDLRQFVTEGEIAWSAFRSPFLIVLPILMPIAYLILNRGKRRAEKWLIQLSESAEESSAVHKVKQGA